MDQPDEARRGRPRVLENSEVMRFTASEAQADALRAEAARLGVPVPAVIRAAVNALLFDGERR